jgi:hypothetical protein
MSTDSNSINKETGLKKFLLDPKSGVNSVRSYLSDTIAPAPEQTQDTKSGPGAPNWNQPQFADNSGHLGPNMNNGQVPFNQTFAAPRPTSATSFHPDQLIQQPQQPQQNQNYQGYNPKPEDRSGTSKLESFVANILDFPSQPEPSQTVFPPMAPTPVHAAGQFMPPFPGEQAPYPAPSQSVLYPSTNSLAQHFAGASLGGAPVDLGHQNNQGQSLAPPPEDMNSATGPVAAPRLYHRMILEFETLRGIFYAARIRKSSLPSRLTAQLIDN